jgi:hypothetical protein
VCGVVVVLYCVVLGCTELCLAVLGCAVLHFTTLLDVVCAHLADYVHYFARQSNIILCIRDTFVTPSLQTCVSVVLLPLWVSRVVMVPALACCEPQRRGQVAAPTADPLAPHILLLAVS